jgi:hypothetical protein
MVEKWLKSFIAAKSSSILSMVTPCPQKKAYIRDDLPGFVKKFVTAHELYHLRDKAKWWVWREIKANIAGAFKHPMGFVVCALMSMAPYRLWYYWKRITGKAE